MNRHFDDARYYFGRGFKHLAAGVATELRPVEYRVRRVVNDQPNPEPRRLDRFRHELREFEDQLEGESQRALRTARDRIRRYRIRA